MLAYNIEKSRMGEFGFDTLNLFTNDEIYCSGFNLDEDSVLEIGNLIRELNYHFDTNSLVSLYLSKKEGDFLVDLKVDTKIGPIFTSAKSDTLDGVIAEVKKKVLIYSSHSNIQPLHGTQPRHCWIQ